MSDSYIIEVDEEAAGLVIRDRGGFKFFAAVSDFAALDGRMFGSTRAAERAACHHVSRHRHIEETGHVKR
jgi:hypothetical protein